MTELRGIPRYYIAIVAMMLILSSFQTPTAAQSQLDSVVVLVDNSHGEHFDPYDADEGFKLMLDMVNASSRYIVKIHEGDPLNDTILEDVDILVLPAPDEEQPFAQSEIGAIAELVNNGSSLFLLGNPMIDQDIPEYWASPAFQDIGENIAINTILDSLNITGVRFSMNHTVSGSQEYDWSDTMFDYENALNSTAPHTIRLDTSTWETAHPIFKNINDIVTMTCTLKPIDGDSIIAWSHEESFAQYRKGPNTFGNLTFPNMSIAEFSEVPLSYSAINGTFPAWLSAFEYNNSRIVMCGSTIMFTGMTLALPEVDARDGNQWFYEGDNRFLFMNMIDWLSGDTLVPPSAITPILMLSAALIAVGVAYFIVQKRRS